MPNGNDKNWVRLLAAVDGFRVRYGNWPKRVRMPTMCLQSLHEGVFSPEAFSQLTAKIELVADDDSLHTAEDDAGNSYCYGTEGFQSNGQSRAR